MGSLMLDMREADIEFRRKVKSLPGAEKLVFCFQCGSCTPDCPVAKRVDAFRPRRIARLALLGFKETLFSGNLLWLCLGCFSCTEICPQDVRPTELIEALRELGTGEGLLPSGIKNLVRSLVSKGRIHAITKTKEKARRKLGLPPLKEPDLEQLRIIFEAAGLGGFSGGGKA